MRRVALGLAATLAAWSGGCATQHAFHRYVDAGLYEEAARTFEQDSTLWNDPEALLLAGRIYSDPSLEVFDLGRARQAMERVVTSFQGSSEAYQAALLLSLFAQLEEVRGELSALTVELETRAAQTDTLAASREAAEREVQALRRRIQRLEADLEQARQELERLKAIDLRRRPSDGR